MVDIPASIFVSKSQSGNPGTITTAVTLLLWFGVSVVLAGVWFIVTVAAHSVDDALPCS
jgi:hypothetical protein